MALWDGREGWFQRCGCWPILKAAAMQAMRAGARKGNTAEMRYLAALQCPTVVEERLPIMAWATAERATNAAMARPSAAPRGGAIVTEREGGGGEKAKGERG